MIDEAQGYRTERINEAKGDVAKYNALLDEYEKYPNITKDRIYLEMMEEILSATSNKVIIDSKLNNILPFLNLNKEAGNN